MIKYLISTIALIASTGMTPAPQPTSSSDLSVAAHSLSGSYEKMLGEIIAVCSDDRLNITQAKGVNNGTVGNLQSLADNTSQAAFVRSDVYRAISDADASYKRFQTLVTLYHEPVHVVVLRSGFQKPGVMGKISPKIHFPSLSDIDGHGVGGGGGTVYTLKILKGMGGGKFNVAPYEKSDEMLAALDKGEIAAATFVGAAPLPNLLKLDKNKYKLIPVGDQIANSLKGVYKPTTLTYSGLSDGPVSSIASQLVILTRRFSTPKKMEAQRRFRECFYKNLDTLKDNGSPGWQLIEKNDKGVIDWYEIPGEGVTK
jgi:TRAP-type uncharacterized transport system substrate-binding protein